MNYIPINELRRLESKGLIEDLTILSNGEVYCRITSSNVAVLSRLANRSDDFEYHQGEYRIHEDARAIKCYYVQFKLPVDSGDVNVDWKAISLDYERQFPECPERDFTVPYGIHSQTCLLTKGNVVHVGTHEAFESDGCGTAKAPLLPTGAFHHKSESDFRFVRDDDLAKFVDTLNRVIPWTSFSKDSFRFVRESDIVAGDRRPIWETQTNNGFGVADYIIPYTVSYVPCHGLGRVAVESLSMSERINRLFKCMHDTRGDYIKTIQVLSVARFPGKDPRVRVKYERKLRSSINVYTGSESLPNMHRGGNRVKFPDDYVPGKDGFYKPLFARGVPRHLDSGFEDFIFFKP